MPNEAIYERLKAAIIAGTKDESLLAVEDALRDGLTPVDIIDKGLSPGMREVGEMFARYDIYLPEMMMSAEAWEHVMKVLEPKIIEMGGERKKMGRVVVGTVHGDIHSIGKNIVVAMLKMNGFEVFDLGIDVRASAFVAKAQEINADVIAVSALMVTTLPQQKNIIEHLEAQGTRDKYCILVGGGCTTQDWADSIGADGYGKTAGDAVTLALKAVSLKEAIQ
jgi:corrinoid protein of di/trimethylamine methyltransferase